MRRRERLSRLIEPGSHGDVELIPDFTLADQSLEILTILETLTLLEILTIADCQDEVRHALIAPIRSAGDPGTRCWHAA